jgi:hypothetical protein
MIDVKPVEQTPNRLGDWIRSLMYPVVPLLAVVSIWAYAYANSLDSKLQRQMRSQEDESTFSETAPVGHFVIHRRDQTVEGLHVTSVDDLDQP